jgi:uncharacterized membrane protein YphA (DoxX/SURF4 family)
MDATPDIVRTAIGIVFLMSFLGKARDVDGFLDSVVDYEILGRRIAIVLGAVVIPLEAVVAISLLTGIQARVGEVLALVLLGIFTVGVGVNLARGRRVACGCFGARDKERISTRTMFRLALLAAGVAVALVYGSTMPLITESLVGTAVRISLVVLVLVAASWVLAVPEMAWLVAARGRSR